MQCTANCGIGEQRRDVICVKKIDDESRIVPEKNCAAAKPDSKQTCIMPNCTGEWFMSDWSEVIREKIVSYIFTVLLRPIINVRFLSFFYSARLIVEEAPGVVR